MLLHTELLNSALWLTSSAYSGTRAGSIPLAYYCLAETTRRLLGLSLCVCVCARDRAMFHASGYKLFLEFCVHAREREREGRQGGSARFLAGFL